MVVRGIEVQRTLQGGRATLATKWFASRIRFASAWIGYALPMRLAAPSTSLLLLIGRRCQR